MGFSYSGKTKVHAVINQKGGVGKTTTTANLGYTYAQQGYDVLLIDFDCQASLTNYFNVGLRNDDYLSVYEALYKDLAEDDPYVDISDEPYGPDCSWEEFFSKAILRPQYNVSCSKLIDGERQIIDEPYEFGISLLPSKMDLSDYGLRLTKSRASNGMQLLSLIDRIIRWHEYDYIFIDCSPALDLITTNAMAASLNGIIIPTNLDMMSLRGVKNLINTIAEVQGTFVYGKDIPHYGIVGIVLNLFADRRTVDKSIQDNMERFYPFKIFESSIPESIDAKKAVLSGRTYCQQNRKAAKAYECLADEIAAKVLEMEKDAPKIYRLVDADENSPDAKTWEAITEETWRKEHS